MIRITVIFIATLPSLLHAMVNGYSSYREWGNDPNLEAILFKKPESYNNDEEAFKEAWNKIKKIQTQAKETGGSRFLNQAYAKAEANLTCYKKRLPEGRGDELAKQLEQEWSKNNEFKEKDH